MFGDSRQYAELGQTTFDGGEERVISNIDSEGKHCHVTRVPSLLPSVLYLPLLGGINPLKYKSLVQNSMFRSRLS